MNANRLTTPKEKVQQLREKLGHAAEENKKRKFHSLYDKVHRWDVLCEAWKRVRANKGAAGRRRIRLSRHAPSENKSRNIPRQRVFHNATVVNEKGRRTHTGSG
ncbi:hypothetical protein [Paenibacillus sp. V4I5]|uniref:hypothetical protein n=1 Tax=Paenibacillus sp. V4I5 TaxID=3042306 RepID=UPI00278F89B0|nr:hypothetical protein [Paenibacillus sp. V4I5]MDQ0914517.1 hypothetical protein [Paenibacillus sp. V4I5]